MASSSDNNLLIDLDASSGTNSTIESNASLRMPGESIANVTDSVSLFRSTVPLYKLLDSHGMGSIDAADNNPFDCMVKQAGLLDDPFEIVENAAKANPSTNLEHQYVKTGTLISLDSLDLPSPSAVSNQTEIIEISSSSSDAGHRESITDKQMPNPDPTGNTVNDDQTPPPATTHNAFAGMVNNMSTPLSRSSAKTKSSALHLLKFSLSNNRMDSTSDNGSPILVDHENLSGEEYATVLHQKMLDSKTLMLRTPAADESFDDLSATKPNWVVDSETDMENDSDVDSDIAKLNIPMLTTKIASESGDMAAAVKPTAAEQKRIVNESKSRHQDAVLNRDKLMEKLASIKLRHPSPAGDEESTEIVQENHVNNVPLIQLDAGIRTPNSELARSALSASLKAENSNSLIENLKKIVDQCDDKQKQLQAKTLLESLCTILKLDGEKKQVACDKSSSSFEQTPPKPIVRQGTFNIDRGNDGEGKREISPDDDTAVTPKTSHEPITSHEPKSQSPSETGTMNSALSQVLKDLQIVLGTNQCVNVVQTNIPPQTTDGTNPTYIVVMGASSNDTMEISSPQLNVTHRTYRSHSFSSRDRPVAAARAAQVKAEQQRPQQMASTCQTPMRPPTLTRRSSFGSITRSNTNEQVALPPKPATTILRRRSLQGPMPTSNLRPPSPKSSFSAKSTTPFNLTAMSSDSMPAKRRSLLSSSNVAAKDSPSKMKSSYSIIKKPQAPPLVRNLKIRVKESFAGRSSAPMRAVVPMNRVAPLMMINESVSPIDDKRRKGLITSTPRSLAMPAVTGANTSFKDLPGACSTPSATTPMRPIRRDTNFTSVTPKPMMRDAASKPSAPSLTRRRSLSDYRGPATAPAQNTALKSANKMGSGLLGSALGKFAQSKLTKMGLSKPQSTTVLVRSKENNIPK